MRHFTVNCQGDLRKEAAAAGFKAYYANGVTAIEIRAYDKAGAASLASAHGWIVLFVFE